MPPRFAAVAGVPQGKRKPPQAGKPRRVLDPRVSYAATGLKLTRRSPLHMAVKPCPTYDLPLFTQHSARALPLPVL